ncbi:hypothetical protein IQ255_28230 [Pleurocapsales cyanobacterium LEGE 10410]|nr:hypothetical protein [Pleurocapsales cyanobacterium LEGE 10410]
MRQNERRLRQNDWVVLQKVKQKRTSDDFNLIFLLLNIDVFDRQMSQ